MATNFPTSVDVLTNPVSNDSLNSPSHSAQHANANDAIEAIEGYLLTGAGAAGLVKLIPTGATNGTVLANGDVTIGNAVSSVTVNGAFSATYDNYKIIVSGGAGSTSNAVLSLKLGASTTTYYEFMIYGGYGSATVGGAANNGVTGSFQWAGGADTNGIYFNVELQNPFLTKYTRYGTSQAFNTSVETGVSSGVHKTASSYTDFTITTNNGTLTGGTIRIYGYK